MNNEWKNTKLGDVLTLQRGFDLPSQNRIEGAFPIVSSSGITGYHNEYKVKGPAVITGRYGTIGNVYYIDKPCWPLNTTLFVKDFKGNDPRFISYFLSLLNFSKYTDKAVVPGVNRNHLHSEDVIIPPLPEQKSIAAILSSLDDKIELNNRINRTLEETVQAIFKRWFVDFEFPDENGNPYKSAGDKVVRLDQLVDFNPTEHINKNQPVRFYDMACLSNTGMEMNEGVIRDTPTGSCFRKYDVLVAKITPCLENGKTGLVLDLEDNQVACGSTEFIVMRAKEGVSPFWVYCLSKSSEFREKAINSMTGTSGRQRVQVNAIKEYLVSFDIDKMKSFDNLARSIVEKIHTNICENRRLSVVRDLLLPKLISGSISVS